MAGRESGQARLEVLLSASAADLHDLVHENTAASATVYTDEWSGFAGLDRKHESCRHTPGSREWARDADGDGVREVHDNTCEGLWTGLRAFLRPFRGVSKWHLYGYVAVFQWGYNAKAVSPAFIRALCGLRTRSTKTGS